jgi:hypothetical protein
MSEAKQILSETASKRSKTIREFRVSTISKSRAALMAEIMTRLERVRQLDRIAQSLEGVRHEN